MKIRDITATLERFAPLSYQEAYDNSGLLTGNFEWETKSALLTLDCTEEIVEEAIQNKCNLIIAHHPILFSGLKKINGSSYIERTLIKAIKNDIAIYACHTNLDNVNEGVNQKIAEKLGMKETYILAPKSHLLKKLVVFVPKSHQQKVLEALFSVGAGQIGNYDSCSFSSDGIGTFKGNHDSKPFVGKPKELSRENEARIEVVYEAYKENEVVNVLLENHPYEEVAYDLYSISNPYTKVGSGLIGKLEAPMKARDFMEHVKTSLRVPVLRHTAIVSDTIQKIAVCGGSGSFLLKNAIAAGADAFVTADLKYHQFFDAEQKILTIDAGHFETEQFTPEIFYEIIQNKFPTFAIHLSKINTNPINYF